MRASLFRVTPLAGGVAVALSLLATPAAAQTADGIAQDFYGSSRATNYVDDGCFFDGRTAFHESCVIGQHTVETSGWVSRTGRLHAGVWIESPLTGGAASGHASVGFTDVLLVRSDVETSFLRFFVYLHASLSTYAAASLSVSGATGTTCGPEVCSRPGVELSGEEHMPGTWNVERLRVTVPVIGGVARFGMSMWAEAFLPRYDCDGCATPGSLVRAAYADASHTGGLEAIEALDAAGNPMSGFELTSLNGFTYEVAGGTMAGAAGPGGGVTTTPEPASLALVGGGLVALGGAAVRRRRDA